ncbi:Phenylacetic acid degradation protein PaaD, thioesterase [Marinobacterium lacunae]|uniref:Phenylacetic acid degradation protein PaaD, thioesterase n=1 Tax=Marinobacterium lacunae TaxID=1232683 RepID=A0A081FXP7_9GAMM|nr:hydroxyphenylacetyl-CoA thioesterase PaaI [Marinobacterium lacunae]KEA63302.1 Phenylacetic acid degradation protein PaaD, thioesterase [Marinobacterium lacunae]
MTDITEMSAQQLAEACADAMYSRDTATRALGMKIERIAPGEATLSMTVTEQMIQGHDSCHGGYIFTLADSTFAFACNTYNTITVAQGCTIDYVAPGKLGDRLTATAKEQSRGKRTGVYDIRIENQRGETVALFRGKSYQVRGTLIEAPSSQTA